MSLQAFLSRFFLFTLLLASHCVISLSVASTAGQGVEMRPVAAPAGLLVVLDEVRRRMGTFQVCGLCTCCGGPRNVCLPSSCCYAINCNLPNRPFGVCALTPRSCGCVGCSF
ncbi:uncharacterized protein LOC144716178 [Wolffia australiana]